VACEISVCNFAPFFVRHICRTVDSLFHAAYSHFSAS
jgi:hypothetical protein